MAPTRSSHLRRRKHGPFSRRGASDTTRRIMFQTTLAPLNGSQLSQRASEPVPVLGRQIGADLWLVRVPSAATLNFVVRREPDQAARTYLENLLQSNVPSQINLRAQVSDGAATGASVDTAHVEPAELLIRSTPGYAGLKRWVYGSVTAHRAARHNMAPYKLFKVGRSTNRRQVERSDPILRRTPC
jgi:hypothetical protein